MKKRNILVLMIYAIIVQTIIFQSCKKDEEETEPVVPVVITPDTIKPVITLKGSNVMNMVFSSTWTDPGYVATDNVDGDITSSVTVSGVINNQSAGPYTLTYNVKDKAGNSAVPVKRIVTVDAAPFLAGNYAVDDWDGTTNPHFFYTENITTSTTEKNKIYFNKFGDYSNAIVVATISGTSITIQEQKIICGINPTVEHIFKGTGTFTNSKEIHINYSDSSSEGNFPNCIAILTVL